MCWALPNSADSLGIGPLPLFESSWNSLDPVAGRLQAEGLRAWNLRLAPILGLRVFKREIQGIWGVQCTALFWAPRPLTDVKTTPEALQIQDCSAQGPLLEVRGLI